MCMWALSCMHFPISFLNSQLAFSSIWTVSCQLAEINYKDDSRKLLIIIICFSNEQMLSVASSTLQTKIHLCTFRCMCMCVHICFCASITDSCPSWTKRGPAVATKSFSSTIANCCNMQCTHTQENTHTHIHTHTHMHVDIQIKLGSANTSGLNTWTFRSCLVSAPCWPLRCQSMWQDVCLTDSSTELIFSGCCVVYCVAARIHALVSRSKCWQLK